MASNKNSVDFRDRMGTVDELGKRIWVYPKKPKGWYYNLRTLLSWVLIALLIGVPFIKVGGEPLFLFNVIQRKFILFGMVFTPQDFHLLAIGMITIMIFVVLFTVVFGRLFCGWVCPQTIFMEMVFRKIEYWIEGDANAQKRLNKAPNSWNKIWRKTLKHLIFFSIAVLISNVFLSWVIGVDQVQSIIEDPVSEHWAGFFSMLFFSLLFYGVFAFFREQVCVAVCPYGRLQSVLLVNQSIVVLYDWIRGEPRGKMQKNKTKDDNQEILQEKGDCIDCGLCVQVCPTGIDIRNGTQLECINCTACMDACDEVMNKIGRPEKLIRYDSLDNIEKGKRKLLSPRVLAYSAVLIALVLFQGFLFYSRSDVELLITRSQGALYYEQNDSIVSNLYNYKIVNKTLQDIGGLSIELENNKGKVRLIGGKIDDSPSLGYSEGTFFLDVSKSEVKERKTEFTLSVSSNGQRLGDCGTTFFKPQ